jgi:hypothetical protein
MYDALKSGGRGKSQEIVEATDKKVKPKVRECKAIGSYLPCDSSSP